MDSLEDVEFLARSENRVQALRLLSTEAYGRWELVGGLGISVSTVNRILNGFEARGWVTTDDETGRQYRATPSGALMSAAFDSLLKETERAQNLAAVLPWLPESDVPFDPRRLADATITLPAKGDPIAPVHREVEQMRSATSVRLLPVGYVAESLRTNWDAVVENGQSFEAVFTTEILDCIAADPRATDYLSDLLRAGCEIYHYSGTVPYGVSESDGQFAIGLVDDGGAPKALVETNDEAVGEWVRSVYEAYRGTSERLELSSWAERLVQVARV